MKKGKSHIPSNVIERLKKEKKQSEDRYFKLGYSDGKKAVQKMSYDELRLFQFLYSGVTDEALSPDLYDPGIIVNSSLWEEGHWFMQAIDKKQNEDLAFDMDNYLRGYTKAIVEFWKEVKGELNFDEDENE